MSLLRPVRIEPAPPAKTLLLCDKSYTPISLCLLTSLIPYARNPRRNEDAVDLLLRLGREYIASYHEDRTHIGLKKETPASRPVESRPDPPSGVLALPRIGGLHHRYTCSLAA